jgi:hypothetical protein
VKYFSKAIKYRVKRLIGENKINKEIGKGKDMESEEERERRNGEGSKR